MPELKPCPACGEAKSIVFIQDEFNNEWRGHCRCGHVGRYCATREAAIAAWNSLPRRPDYNDVDCADCPERRRGLLTWTTEPPKVPGWYWRKETAAGRAHVFHFTGNWEDYGEHWESDRVCPLPLILNDNLWAGPIPTPLEPEES